MRPPTWKETAAVSLGMLLPAPPFGDKLWSPRAALHQEYMVLWEGLLMLGEVSYHHREGTAGHRLLTPASSNVSESLPPAMLPPPQNKDKIKTPDYQALLRTGVVWVGSRLWEKSPSTSSTTYSKMNACFKKHLSVLQAYEPSGKSWLPQLPPSTLALRPYYSEASKIAPSIPPLSQNRTQRRLNLGLSGPDFGMGVI